jgi:hypothetical protein
VQCSGYRDLLPLAFRDESKKIVDKYQSNTQIWSTPKNCSKNGQGSFLIQWRTSDKTPVGNRLCHQVLEKGQSHTLRPPIPEVELHISLDDVASNYLFNLYLRGSHYKYLDKLLQNNCTKASVCLQDCLLAVGLAGLSQESKQSQIMVTAKRHYGRALRNVNLALRSAEPQNCSDIVPSVMLLALFESTTHTTHDSADQWNQHLHGALALVAQQDSHHTWLANNPDLFLHISYGVRVSCVRRKTKIPPLLLSLSEEMGPLLNVDPALPPLRFSKITEDFTDLQSQINEGTLLDASVIVCTALSIDLQCRRLASDLPSGWAFDTVIVRDCDPTIYCQKYHLYNTHQVAQFWNTVRMTRLYLHEIIYNHLTILDQVECLSGQHSRGFFHCRENSLVTARSLATEILSSIPQFLGHPQKLSSATPLQFAQILSLLWPLQAVGTSHLIGNGPERQYIIHRLQYMVEKGIWQAEEVLQNVRNGEVSPTHDW